jgi:hypothetical protein
MSTRALINVPDWIKIVDGDAPEYFLKFKSS